MESRFIRLASVGLIVRAPKPVAWGTVDSLFDEEVGVPTSSLVGFPGVRKAFIDEDLEWSDPPDGVRSCSLGSREGGWSDLALNTRGVSKFAPVSSAPVPVSLVWFEVVVCSCRWPSVLVFFKKLGLLRSPLPAESNVTVPGPTDFLGGLNVVVAFDEGAGTLLCRRARSPGGGGGPIVEFDWLGGREMLFWRWAREPLRAVLPGGFCEDVLLSCPVPPCPGRGK